MGLLIQKPKPEIHTRRGCLCCEHGVRSRFSSRTDGLITWQRQSDEWNSIPIDARNEFAPDQRCDSSRFLQSKRFFASGLPDSKPFTLTRHRLPLILTVHFITLRLRELSCYSLACTPTPSFDSPTSPHEHVPPRCQQGTGASRADAPWHTDPSISHPPRPQRNRSITRLESTLTQMFI